MSKDWIYVQIIPKKRTTKMLIHKWKTARLKFWYNLGIIPLTTMFSVYVPTY